jgi:hypothetical protein
VVSETLRALESSRCALRVSQQLAPRHHDGLAAEIAALGAHGVGMAAPLS